MRLFYSLLRLSLVIIAPGISMAQHSETLDDPYLPPANTAGPKTSPAFQYTGANVFITQVNIDSDGNNILNDAANEPSIAINALDPSRMVIGWRQFDNIQSNFRQAGFGYTTDGGQTWTFPGVIDPGIFRSDPVLASDAEGRIFYNSLTVGNNNNFHCDVYRSTGDGTWDDGVYAVGGDKAWMAIDQTDGPGKGHIYSNWNGGFSDCANGSDFTRSTDDGDSYEYCTTFTPGIYWGTISIGPDGTLYMSGNGGDVVWSSNAQNDGEDVIFDGISYADLNYDYQAMGGPTPNPGGLLGQCYIATNHSPGPLNGQIYVLQSVRQQGGNDPRDVMFSRSSDGGLNWTPAVKINDDLGETWQWFGTMSVAPNGRIDVVWLDTRDNPGMLLSALYYSYSTDGGDIWSPNEQLSPSFDPHIGWPNQDKMGDYFHMVSDNSGAHLAWAATFTGGQDVYYAHITLPNSATTEADKHINQTLKINPNPMIDQSTIQYDTDIAGRVNIQIFNQMGVLVSSIKDEAEIPGHYSQIWNGLGTNGQKLPAGIYYCQLSVNEKPAGFEKIVLMR
ncbi:MAG: hypothetical protein H6576_14470 [Lewinellaceae bacterium]|nr:hypothetical protein [Lewinellaceae bacterium]